MSSIPLETIIEETSQTSSINTSPTHNYLEVISNVEGTDTTFMEDETVNTAATNTAATNTAVINAINEIEPVTNTSTQNSIQTTPSKYDPELKEYIEPTLNTLTSLVNGINVGADNWILLLTKAMYVVSLIKSLDADKKVRLSVELVIRYLDDYTTIEDSVLIGIKSSIYSMCIVMVNNSGILHEKVTKPAIIIGDPDILATPLQITDLVIKKLINLVKSRNLNVQEIKALFPELVVLCITTVEKYPHFTGLDKKNLVIQIIQRFLSDYIPLTMTVSDEERQGLDILSQSLPFLIDTLVNVGRGKANYKFDFSNPETLNKLTQLVLCLLSCFKRSKSTTA